MVDQIEIRSCGEIRHNYLPVGQIKWQSGFPQEYVGDWFLEGGPDQLQIETLEEEAQGLEEELSEAEKERDDAVEDAAEVGRNLTALQDEVRAFLAGNSFCDVATSRLREALEASE